MKRLLVAGSCLAAAAALAFFAFASPLARDPFPQAIPAAVGAITVGVEEFATLPFSGDRPAQMMRLVHEPLTGRIFVSETRGHVYAVSRDGGTVTQYLNLKDPRWKLRQRGFPGFAVHPQYGRPGTPGFGKLYTFIGTADTAPPPDFAPRGGWDARDTLLLEWTATDPRALVYDGGPPRELLRMAQPFAHHNGGDIAFNPFAAPGDPDFGLLYVGTADGGGGGDPLGVAQDLGSAMGKILRIDPLGTDSANMQYGVPADNPFGGAVGRLGEVYAYGVRNPQRLAWDEANGNLFLADIGENVVEEIGLVPRGGNLGWSDWEGSYRYIGFPYLSRFALRVNRFGAVGVTWPVVEYSRHDPLFEGRGVAVTGLVVYRGDAVPLLSGRVLFADGPSGEVFHFAADELPGGGQAAIRRVLFHHEGETRTLLQMIQERNAAQGRKPATRADVRLDSGPNGQIYLLNKHDGTIRRAVASRGHVP